VLEEFPDTVILRPSLVFGPEDIPFWLAKLGAFLTVPMPKSRRPAEVDQIRMLELDSIVSDAAEAEGRTLACFGIKHPHTTVSIVPPYLERFFPRGQFAHYRFLKNGLGL
jgi:NADH dehydrogenase